MCSTGCPFIPPAIEDRALSLTCDIPSECLVAVIVTDLLMALEGLFSTMNMVGVPEQTR